MNPRDYSDRNAKELYENLERDGWTCKRISKARQKDRGIPDAIVARRGDPFRRTHLLEVKSLGGRLRPEQMAFAIEWPGCVHVATSSWEAGQLLKECEESIRYTLKKESA
jgi:hypothetical protein